jgi:hypothetical protein
MEEGISPVNRFPSKYLEIKSENKSMSEHLSSNSDDCSSTYKCCKLTRFPMEEGISPVNRFSLNSLEIKSENKSVII